MVLGIFFLALLGLQNLLEFKRLWCIQAPPNSWTLVDLFGPFLDLPVIFSLGPFLLQTSHFASDLSRHDHMLHSPFIFISISIFLFSLPKKLTKTRKRAPTENHPVHYQPTQPNSPMKNTQYPQWYTYHLQSKVRCRCQDRLFHLLWKLWCLLRCGCLLFARANDVRGRCRGVWSVWCESNARVGKPME